jgi:hypothetical protein
MIRQALLLGVGQLRVRTRGAVGRARRATGVVGGGEASEAGHREPGDDEGAEGNGHDPAGTRTTAGGFAHVVLLGRRYELAFQDPDATDLRGL